MIFYLRRVALATVLFFSVGISSSVYAADVDSIHFLIPGGAGGGWDGTARGTGEALTKSGLVGSASYENMSGGGGGKAIGFLIENAASNHGTLMVNSTPIVIRSLVGRFPHNFRDLTMIAGTIGDYAAIITVKIVHIIILLIWLKHIKLIHLLFLLVVAQYLVVWII